MKDKRKMTIVVLGTVLTAALAILLFYSKDGFWNSLEQKIKQGQETVYLKDLTDFNWDTVCVLEPYSLGPKPYDDAKLNQLIKANNTKLFADKIPNLNDDTDWGFVFIQQNEIVKIKDKNTRLPLAKRFGSNCISKERAVFVKEADTIFIQD